MHRIRTVAATIVVGIASLSVVGTAAAAHQTKNTKFDQPAKCVKLSKKSNKMRCTVKTVTGRPGANGSNGAPGVNGVNGKDGTNGKDGLNGTNGLNGVSGYEVRTYDYIKGIGHRPGFDGAPAGYVGANNGAIATVKCSSDDKVAVAGGYFIRNGASEVVQSPNMGQGAGVVASFPGRMDWSTNSPRPGVYSGWIVQFNGNGGPTFDATLYVVCINAA